MGWGYFLFSLFLAYFVLAVGADQDQCIALSYYYHYGGPPPLTQTPAHFSYPGLFLGRLSPLRILPFLTEDWRTLFLLHWFFNLSFSCCLFLCLVLGEALVPFCLIY